MPLSDTRRRLLGRLHWRKTREREGRVLVEGVRAVTEALRNGARPRFVLRSPRVESAWTRALEESLARSGVPVEGITDGEMAEVAGTETPQGVLLVADEPVPDPAAIWGPGDPKVLMLDGVQDPGNAGTLVRVAAAFACTGVVALDRTTDLWGARALRASAGTAFRIPILHCRWGDIRGELERRKVMLISADAVGRRVDTERPSSGWVLAVGAEGSGCRPEVLRQSDAVVAVPMPGGVESLNVGVAGAILLYELVEGRRR